MKKIIFQEGKQKSVTKNITVCSTTGDRDVAFHLLKKKKKKQKYENEMENCYDQGIYI